MTSWRVATFNIRHGLGPDERVDLPRLAGQIAALDADGAEVARATGAPTRPQVLRALGHAVD